jgi:hypothetical protein
MQIIKTFVRLAIFISPVMAAAQTTYLPKDSKEEHFIERMEIKQRKNTNILFSTTRPFNRRAVVKEAEYLDSMHKWKMSKADEYNLQSLYMDNSEWVSGSKPYKPYFMSKKPVLNAFYKTKTNAIEVNNKDFFLAVNPMLNVQIGKESNNDQHLYLDTRGITVRGMIGHKVGFSSSISDNQERGPAYFNSNVNQYGAVPGVGFYKLFKINKGYDYFDGRGYFTFSAAKFIDFQFGYDKNFIGNGYRSLFLSDNGNSYLFLKINTKIWKLNYQNLFMELMPTGKYPSIGGDTLMVRKYAAMHHLSINATKWLNVGLFESIIFGRVDHFDFQYLNPIIFLRHIEGTVGSPDKAFLGLDFKANAMNRFQFYGQFLLTEFHINELTKNNGYWANKYGLQLGAKYIDAFGVNNLDLQLELNRVRPYTYQHIDSLANYSHYNQPLAHPLGSNFSEVVAIAKYQPLPRVYLTGRIVYYNHGLDSAGVNFGGNVFESYLTRPRDFGLKIGSGDKETVVNASLQGSYELRQNLFIEGSLMIRSDKVASIPANANSSTVILGIRWNMFKRDYDL